MIASGAKKSVSGYFLYKYVYNEQVIYVGITKDIVRRVADHARCVGLDEKFKPYLPQSTVYVHKCASSGEMRGLESLLIEHYKPILNSSQKSNKPMSVCLPQDFIGWLEYREDDWVAAPRLRGCKANKHRREQNHAYFLLTELQKICNTVRKYPSLLSAESEWWDATTWLGVAPGSMSDVDDRLNAALFWPVCLYASQSGTRNLMLWDKVSIEAGRVYIHICKNKFASLMEVANQLMASYQRVLDGTGSLLPEDELPEPLRK